MKTEKIKIKELSQDEIFKIFKENSLFGEFSFVVIGDSNKESYVDYVSEENIKELDLRCNEILSKSYSSHYNQLMLISGHNNIGLLTREGTNAHITYGLETEMDYDSGYTNLTKKAFESAKNEIKSEVLLKTLHSQTFEEDKGIHARRF